MYDPNRPRLNSGGQAKPGYSGVNSAPKPASSGSTYMPSASNYKPPTGGYGYGGNQTVQNNFNKFK